jgi:hypothetical protein
VLDSMDAVKLGALRPRSLLVLQRIAPAARSLNSNPLGKAGEGRLARRRRLGLGASISASDGACTGVRDGAMARVEVITGRERRRRWSAEQKRAIVLESFAPGAIVSDVARGADISSGQIYR